MPEAKTMNIHQKVLAVRAAVDRVPKTGHNKFQGYDYATDDDIIKAVRPHLIDNGLSYTVDVPVIESSEVETKTGGKQNMRRAQMQFTLVNVDDPKEIIGVTFWGEGQDAGDKGLYKAYTGGEKYFLMKTFMIPTGDDPERDGEAAEGSTKAPVMSSTAAPPPGALGLPLVDKGANLAEDKGTTLDEYRARIGNMLKDMSGGDKERAADLLSNASAFQGDDGAVKSVRDVRKLSLGWARSTCHKIEKDYQKWVAEQVDPDAEIKKFIEEGGEVP